jgi:site-specific recombinase XerD
MSNRRTHELYRAFSKWGWDAKGYTPRTRYQYYILALRAEAWMREHRGRSLAWASEKDLKAFVFSLEPSAASRNGARAGLIALFEFFIEQGVTDHNPARGLPRLPTPRPLPKALAAEEADKMLGVARALQPEVAALFFTFAYAGLRIAELQKLEWRNIGHDGWIRFTGKGNKDRAVPVHAELEPLLAKWKVECPSVRWVFPSPRDPDRPMSFTTIRRHVREIGETIGSDVHPHVMRHTIATRMLETGADLRTVQEFLGHASVSTTQIYTRVRSPRVADAMKRVTYKKIPGES